MSFKKIISVSFMALGLVLASCGGSSPATQASTVTAQVPPPPPPPPVSGSPSFSPGVFAPREDFVDQCETPRSGTDPDGNRFPDQAGSETLEKFWLRSWSDETYLWNDEIIDTDPNDTDGRVPYFDILVTNELSETGSGREKDDFHFSESTEDFFERRNSEATSGYGLRLAFINSSPPRDIRVLYTEPNSPAATVQNGSVNFPRGAQLITIDGEDVINGSDVDTLNNGLFPATADEAHTFTVRDPGSSTTRTFTVTSQDIAQAPVNRTEIIDTPTGRVGYMLFNTFSPFESERSLNNAFRQLANQNIDDLVLDLRYNGGGLVAVAAQLGFMIAGPNRTRGRTATLLQYNEAAGNRNPITGEIVDPIPFIDEGVGFSVNAGVDLATVDLPRVFILSTEGTCSASELVINSLRGIGFEVVLIGDTTCGKPYGFLPTDNCGRTYYTIQFRSVNDVGFGDYSDGFSPQDSTNQFSEKTSGCTVADDLSRELGDPQEALLSTAIFYRENGSCPVNTTSSKLSPPINYTKTFTAPNTAGALNAQSDPFETTIDSFLDATMPTGGQ